MYILEITTVAMPEIADLRFQINQFDAVRKAMVHVLHMLVVNPVALDETSLDAVEERLFDARELGVGQQMPRHAGSGYTVPEPGRSGLRGMMKIQTQRDQLAHNDRGFLQMGYDWTAAATATLLRLARRSAGMSARRIPSGRNRCLECPTRWER